MEKISTKTNSLWLFSLLINIITFSIIYYKIHPGKGLLALHYNVLVGVDLYGKSREIYLIPGIGLIIGLINYTLYRFTAKKNYFLPTLASLVTLFIQVILMLAVLFLTRVN